MVYDTLSGKLSYIGLSTLTVDVNGVGYRITAPSTVLSTLEISKDVVLYTSLVVRENAHTLYGFKTREDRDLFEELLNISGVGPKTACAVLGHMSHDEFIQAVIEGNEKLLLRVPGLGKKSAHRLILDIKDKLPKVSLSSAPNLKRSSAWDDAASALVNLGFTSAVAHNMLKSAIEKGADGADIESLLKEALQSGR